MIIDDFICTYNVGTWRCVGFAYNYTTLHCLALHCTALHNITLHYITLHYITIHYIALHTYINVM